MDSYPCKGYLSESQCSDLVRNSNSARISHLHLYPLHNLYSHVITYYRNFRIFISVYIPIMNETAA